MSDFSPYDETGYEFKIVRCPKCGEIGKLARRTRSHLKRKRYYWQVRHSSDDYCYLGKKLPKEIIDQIERKQP